MHSRTKMAFLLVVAAAAALFFYAVRAILTPFALSAAFAYLVHPLVDAIERRSVPRTYAIIIAYMALAACAVLFWYLVVPPLQMQMREIADTLPQQAERLQALVHDLLSHLRNLGVPPTLQAGVDLGIQRLELWAEGIAGRIASWVLGAASSLVLMILVPILGFYLLRDSARISRGLIDWMPLSLREEALAAGREIDGVVFGFLRGQLIVSLCVGVIIAVGLGALGIPYALVLGLIAAVFDIIPYLGPVLGATPAVILALAISPVTALWVVVLIVLVHQFEGGVLAPKIVGDSVGLHPLVIIFAVLAGGDLYGLLGMLFAVPAAAALNVLGRYVYRGLTGALTVE